jgi:hypothetical protein
MDKRVADLQRACPELFLVRDGILAGLDDNLMLIASCLRRSTVPDRVPPAEVAARSPTDQRLASPAQNVEASIRRLTPKNLKNLLETQSCALKDLLNTPQMQVAGLKPILDR